QRTRRWDRTQRVVAMRRRVGDRGDVIGARAPRVKENVRSEAPGRGYPDRLRILDLADLDDLVLRAQRETLEQRHADAGAVHEVVLGLVEQLLAAQADLEVIEEPAVLRKQLDRADRQRRDQRRRDAFCVRLDRQQVERGGRVAEIEVVELHRDRAVEAPAGEYPLRVAGLVEVDIDVFDITDLGGEVAEPRTEVQA